MKKLIVLILPILLFSCFGESKEVKQAKQELLGTNSGVTNSEENISNETQTGETQIEQEIKSYYKINYLTDKFIDIEPITNIENIKEDLDIKGIVNNPDINKIVVNFENSTSKFPTDNYVLQTFKKGDTSFLYRAYKRYQVLDYGLNKYTIDAYVGENLISKIELEVFISSPIEKTSSGITSNITGTGVSDYVPKTVGGEDDNVFLHLPVDENTYGKPIMTGESSLTYSNITGFEVSKNSEITQTTCENFGDYLKQNYTWYYWNTCRPVYEDSFSTYVLTLIGDKYKYEKHYIDRKYNLYGVVLLESGEGIKQSDMQAKNDELKVKTYEITTKTDKLFKDLLK